MNKRKEIVARKDERNEIETYAAQEFASTGAQIGPWLNTHDARTYQSLLGVGSGDG